MGRFTGFGQKDRHAWIVYGLPFEMYAGKTNALEGRLNVHYNQQNKDVHEWIILDVCYTEQEALEKEAIRHEEGWKGSVLERKKLSNKELMELRRMGDEKIKTHAQLSMFFGVPYGTISKLMNRTRRPGTEYDGSPYTKQQK